MKGLYRGKCAFSGEWREGAYYRSKGNSIIRNEDDHESIVIEETVGRFLGLNDVNGKKVFNGDKLKVNQFTQILGGNLGVIESEREFKAEIYIQKLGLWFQAEKEEDSGYIIQFGGFDDVEEQIEIIGNIHDK